jgi:hypothetical protein
VAEVTREKKELEPVQTKMENPCVNSESPEVIGIDSGRVDRLTLIVPNTSSRVAARGPNMKRRYMLNAYPVENMS